MRFILRLIWVALAFVLSGICGAVLGVAVGLEKATGFVNTVANGTVDPGDAIHETFFVVSKIGIFLNPLSLILALGLVIIGETMCIRSFTYYVAGAGIAIGAPPAVRELDLIRSGAIPTHIILLAAVMGFAAGAVYWALAGRKA